MGKISLVLPIYNEQIILRHVLEKYLADLENLRLQKDYNWEVIAVDDASTDESKLILIDYARKYRNFKVVTLANRSGKHAAVTAGIAVANGDLVMTAEIDLQNPMGLFSRLVQEHLDSGAQIIYGYQQFVGWQRRKAFLTDRLTRFACRMFLLDGYFTGIVNAELYTADVAAILRDNPAKTKYMRTMNNWVGWQTKEFWYTREYTDNEAKIKMEQLRNRNREYKAFHKSGHVSSVATWYAVLCAFLAVVAFVLGGTLLKRADPLLICSLFIIGFAMILCMILSLLRSLLLARIGQVKYRDGEIIYEIKSILNNK